MKRSGIFCCLLIGTFAVSMGSLPAQAFDSRQDLRRPRPFRELFERFRQQRLARESLDPAERHSKADRAVAALNLFLRQVIQDQKLTDGQKALRDRYLADPLAQDVYQVLVAKAGDDVEFDEEDIMELLELAKPGLGIENDEEWNGVVAGVMAKLKELPEFTGDSNVNQLLGVVFDALATTLGEGKQLSQVQSVALALTFRQFLGDKKTESVDLMKKSLREAERIRKSGRDPKSALEELRRSEKK